MGNILHRRRARSSEPGEQDTTFIYESALQPPVQLTASVDVTGSSFTEEASMSEDEIIHLNEKILVAPPDDENWLVRLKSRSLQSYDENQRGASIVIPSKDEIVDLNEEISDDENQFVPQESRSLQSYDEHQHWASIVKPSSRRVVVIGASADAKAIIVARDGKFKKSSETTQTEEFKMYRQQHVEASSPMNRRSLDLLEEKFQAACVKTAYKTAKITQRDGGSIELYGYELIFPPGAVEVDKDVELSVDNNPNHYPKSLMPISLIISCKPSKFKKPVKVRLASWFRPRHGRDIKVAILSRPTSQMEWKAIKEATLTTSGFIEYEVMQFSDHTAGISDEEAKRGSIHFYNDVRMNLDTGSILSFLCRDKKSLREWVEELKFRHNRIIDVPTEINIPIDGYINMGMSCISPPAMKMDPEDEFPVKIEKADLETMNKFDFYFYPNPRPSELNGLYEFRYEIEVKDAQTLKVRRRKIPLSYKWPQTQQFHSQARTEESKSSGADQDAKFLVQNLDVKGDCHVGGSNSAVDRSLREKFCVCM